MEDQSDVKLRQHEWKQKVREQLRDAFKSVQCPFISCHLTPSELKDLREEIGAYSDDSLCWLLPRLLEDLLDTSDMENVDCTVSTLDIPGPIDDEDSLQRQRQEYGDADVDEMIRDLTEARARQEERWACINAEQAMAVYEWLRYFASNWEDADLFEKMFSRAIQYWLDRGRS